MMVKTIVLFVVGSLTFLTASHAGDYYDVLGVPRTATREQIIEAYNRLAAETLPDRHPGDSQMVERYKEIVKAFEILADADKRSDYDHHVPEQADVTLTKTYAWASTLPGLTPANRATPAPIGSSANERIFRALKYVASYQGMGGRIIEVWWGGPTNRPQHLFFWQPNGSLILHEMLVSHQFTGQSKGVLFTSFDTQLFDPRVSSGFVPFTLRQDWIKVGSQDFSRDFKISDQAHFEALFPAGKVPQIQWYSDIDYRPMFRGYRYFPYKLNDIYYVIALPVGVTEREFFPKPRLFIGRAGDLEEIKLTEGAQRSQWSYADGSGQYFVAPDNSKAPFVAKADPHTGAFVGQVAHSMPAHFKLYGPEGRVVAMAETLTEGAARQLSLPDLMGPAYQPATFAVRSPLDATVVDLHGKPADTCNVKFKKFGSR